MGWTKMKILYISPDAPYDSVGAAGGQTFNYYIKNMAKVPDAEVSLVTCVFPDEYAKLDTEEAGIRTVCIDWPQGIKRWINVALAADSLINPWHRYGGKINSRYVRMILSRLKGLAASGYKPDVIELEFTDMLLMIHDIRKIFPDAKYVCSEHDVTFLGYMRKAKNAGNIPVREYLTAKANNMYRREISGIESADLVIAHNIKDDRLLKKAGVPDDKRHVIVPYYHISALARHSEAVERSSSDIPDIRPHDIIFFGAMGRMENESAAVWFAENVMPLLSDTDVRFLIVGGGPSERLKRLGSERILITGFVPEIDPYFAGGLCFVAPLIYGAGIKVKTIEALVSGIPVLTNRVGIEGIPVKRDRDYIHCESPEDYEGAIRELLVGQITEDMLKGRESVLERLDMKKSFEQYRERIMTL